MEETLKNLTTLASQIYSPEHPHSPLINPSLNTSNTLALSIIRFLTITKKSIKELLFIHVVLDHVARGARK